MDGGASTMGSEVGAGASTVGSEGEVGASTVGCEGALGACTVGSEVADWRPPDPPPRGDRGGSQPCGTPSPTHGCVGGVQGWSAGHPGA